MRVKIVEISQRDAYKDHPDIIGLVGEFFVDGWLSGSFKTDKGAYYFFHDVRVEEISE